LAMSMAGPAHSAQSIMPRRREAAIISVPPWSDGL
jgi:hypothetical protein